MLTSPRAACLSLWLLLGPGTPSPARAEATSSAAPAACSASRGSLALLGCSLASSLLPQARGASVSVVELTTDQTLPAADALRERLRESVRLALAKPQPDAEPSKLRVELKLDKSGSSLRVTADVRRSVGLWQRLRGHKPRVELHAFVEVPIDAELRALIPSPPLVVSQVLKMKAPERGIVALACGALGEDGGQELALVSRSSVRVGRIVKGGFAERQRVSWSGLSPVAPAPLREPIASAEIPAPGRLRIGITDRKDGLELDARLGVKSRFEGLLPVPGGGCVARAGVGLAGRLEACSKAEPAPGRRLGEVLDALAGARGWQVGRELATSKLAQSEPAAGKLAQGQSAAIALSTSAGAQLALGDGDGDGVPELAYSAGTAEGSADRLTLVSLDGGGPRLRFELAAPSISAIAICAGREGPGMAPIAVVSGEELWLIR